ncbi:MAG: transglutaminase family protein [Pseudomonadota bacterium]
MRLSIHHVTTYRFAEPMRYVVQSQRLTPMPSGGQKILSWDVACPNAVFGTRRTDPGGDEVRTMTLNGPVDVVEITASGQVVTTDTNGVLTGMRERVPPLAYRRDTPLTAPDAAIRALAAEQDEPAPLARAHALSAAVAEALTYEPETTGAATTAAEALAGGQGVCQDYAHVLIAAARQAELPARYVTGYLLASEEAVTGDAGHAWAELHIEGLGWVGFDAANRCCPDERYVRLTSGLDAVSAAPVRGTSFGQAREDLDVTVAVEAAQQ